MRKEQKKCLTEVFDELENQSYFLETTAREIVIQDEYESNEKTWEIYDNIKKARDKIDEALEILELYVN